MKTRIGHLYIEFWDPAGNRIEQINGLATDRNTGAAKRVGLPQNQLRGYLNLRDNVRPFGNGDSQATNTHAGVVLLEGSHDDILRALKAASDAIDRINAGDFSYNLLARKGFNSNSLFHTVARSMQQALPAISDTSIAQAKCLGLTNPGCHKIMLAELAASAQPQEDETPTSGFSARAIMGSVRRRGR